MSGELIRVAEEEERRLLMPASDDCFRFMVDVERLSTREEDDTQGSRGLHRSLTNGRGV